MTRHPAVIDVRIKNSENNTFYYFAVRRDRLQAFYEFMAANRKTSFYGIFVPGISGPALEGLKCLFSRPPDKFPSMDVLNWLRNEQNAYLGGYPSPSITTQEVESALERFRMFTNPLHQDGSGDEIVMEKTEETA